MEEVKCFKCQCHICWMTYSGPTGLHYCDSCYEEKCEEEERLNDES